MTYRTLYRPEYPYDKETVQHGHQNLRLRAKKILSPAWLDWELNSIVDYINNTVVDALLETEKKGFSDVSNMENITKVISTDGEKSQWTKITGDHIANKSLVGDNFDYKCIDPKHIEPRSLSNELFGDNVVDKWNIANNAVTTDKFAPGSVTAEKLIDNCFDEESIALLPLSITSEKIEPRAATTDKIFKGGYLLIEETSGKDVETYEFTLPAVGRDQLASGAITQEKIRNRSITESELGLDEHNDPAVTEFELAQGAITTDKLSDGAVDEDNLSEELGDSEDQRIYWKKIKNGEVSGRHIIDGEIKTQHLIGRFGWYITESIEGCVTTDKIDDRAVLSHHISEWCIFSCHLDDKIALGTEKFTNYDAQLLVGGASATQFGLYAITDEKIANGAITTSKFESGRVYDEDLDKFVDKDGAVTTPKIYQRAVVENKVADNSVSNRVLLDYSEDFKTGSISTNKFIGKGHMGPDDKWVTEIEGAVLKTHLSEDVIDHINKPRLALIKVLETALACC